MPTHLPAISLFLRHPYPQAARVLVPPPGPHIASPCQSPSGRTGFRQPRSYGQVRNDAVCVGRNLLSLSLCLLLLRARNSPFNTKVAVVAVGKLVMCGRNIAQRPVSPLNAKKQVSGHAGAKASSLSTFPCTEIFSLIASSSSYFLGL